MFSRRAVSLDAGATAARTERGGVRGLFAGSPRSKDKKSSSAGNRVLASVFGDDGVALWVAVKAALVRFAGQDSANLLKNELRAIMVHAALQKTKGRFPRDAWWPVVVACKHILWTVSEAVSKAAHVRARGRRTNPFPIADAAQRLVAQMLQTIQDSDLLPKRHSIDTLRRLFELYVEPRFLYSLLNSPDYAADRARIAPALEPFLDVRFQPPDQLCTRPRCVKPAGSSTFCDVHFEMHCSSQLQVQHVLEFLRNPSRVPVFLQFLSEAQHERGHHLVTFWRAAEDYRQCHSAPLRLPRAKRIFARYVDRHSPSSFDFAHHLADDIYTTVELNEAAPSSLFKDVERLALAELEVIYHESFIPSPAHERFVDDVRAQLAAARRLELSLPYPPPAFIVGNAARRDLFLEFGREKLPHLPENVILDAVPGPEFSLPHEVQEAREAFKHEGVLDDAQFDARNALMGVLELDDPASLYARFLLSDYFDEMISCDLASVEDVLKAAVAVRVAPTRHAMREVPAPPAAAGAAEGAVAAAAAAVEAHARRASLRQEGQEAEEVKLAERSASPAHGGESQEQEGPRERSGEGEGEEELPPPPPPSATAVNAIRAARRRRSSTGL